MKIIRLLYPDHVSGGMETYYFGANLMAHILPSNNRQPLVKVNVKAPDGKEKEITEGMYARAEVMSGIRSAMEAIEKENPDRIITIGGNCIVSQASFDYLHGKYENLGIIWIDAHPDVSIVKDGYPNAHAMVLGALLGPGEPSLAALMKNTAFQPEQLLYVGLQGLHDYQEAFLKKMQVDYKVQIDEFVKDEEIIAFARKFDHIVVHFDIDVLDETLFHSTYFANPELVGDGSGGGKMTMEKLNEILHCIADHGNIVGFTIAEYLPFDAYRLHRLFSEFSLFTE